MSQSSKLELVTSESQLSQTPTPGNDDAPVTKSEGTLVGATLNMLNGVFGIGAITIALTFRHAGVVIGLSLMILYACLSSLSSHLLVLTSLQTGHKSVAELLTVGISPLAAAVYDTVLICNTSLYMASYLEATAQWIFHLLLVYTSVIPDNADTHDYTNATILFCAVVALAFCFFKDMKAFEKVSLMKTCFCVLTLVAVVWQSIEHMRGSEECHVATNARSFGSDIAGAVGGIGTVFVCQQWVLHLFWSLPQRDLRSWRKVEHTSTGISLVVHSILGVCGFLAFGALTKDNILQNFERSVVIDICRLLFSVSVLLSLPMQMFACRSSLISLMRYAFDSTKHWSNDNLPTAVFILATLGIWLLCVFDAVFLNLEFIVEFTGVFCGSIIALISPPLIFITFSHQLPSATDFKLRAAKLLLAFGVLFLVVGSLFVVLKHTGVFKSFDEGTKA